jgi:tellurite resistance protein
VYSSPTQLRTRTQPGSVAAADAASPGPALLNILVIPLSAAYVVMRLRGSGSFTAVIVLVVALGVLLAQLLSFWLQGNLPVKALHPGYFLPTAAGGFVCSIGLSLSGWHEAAESAFGVGLFFWLIIGTLIFSRLFTVEPLPDAVKPSLAVLLSPPATAGLAWFFISAATMNTVGYLLLGITIIMLSVQVMFSRSTVSWPSPRISGPSPFPWQPRPISSSGGSTSSASPSGRPGHGPSPGSLRHSSPRSP